MLQVGEPQNLPEEGLAYEMSLGRGVRERRVAAAGGRVKGDGLDSGPLR